MGAEQSNSSVVFDDAYVLKAFRRLEAGDIEIADQPFDVGLLVQSVNGRFAPRAKAKAPVAAKRPMKTSAKAKPPAKKKPAARAAPRPAMKKKQARPAKAAKKATLKKGQKAKPAAKAKKARGKGRR